MSKTKVNNPRLLLAKLRNGDYAHAGESEAIDIILKKISDISEENKKMRINKNYSNEIIRKVLDVGCGLGGTAEYIRNHTSHIVYGIDINEFYINYAKLHYPHINLFQCDINYVKKLFNDEKFDIISMLNVFYTFINQREILEKLGEVAKKNAILIIFDYNYHDESEKSNVELKDLELKPMYPICLTNVKGWLKEAGWELIEIVDISDKYKNWYSKFLKNLNNNKVSLLEEFTEDAFNKVSYTFSSLIKNIKNNKIGGCIVYARYVGSENRVCLRTS